jgi:hypothetical protein
VTAFRPTRLLAALALFAACLALAACGAEESKTGVHEGQPVELGDLEYNVLFARYLNPDDVEDREYLEGQPAPTADQLYLGVFVQVVNNSKESEEAIPEDWILLDSEENEYHPLESESAYALRLGDSVGPEDQVPALDSTPEVGPIEGSMVLFVISDETTEARPLELEIPGEDGPAIVELDI